ncbi:MAG: response regulator transcription factor [Gammaproteobacteria bacterium]|nr:response regulator transcription factor [Gammaproteobacteria bacterium]
MVIADDHDIVRDALRDSLADAGATGEAQYAVVAEANNGLEAIAQVKTHRPDLLFLDVSMPLANGLEVLADLKRWSPATRIVVFTGINSSGLLAGLVESGVDGLFSKGAATGNLIAQLPLILAGGRFVAPELAEQISRGQASLALTDRERQTLNMIIAGKSNREMADMLSISPKTVDKHRTSLMRKLGVHSVAELMALALREGLIDPL